MPQVKDGPKELNHILHVVYMACMKRRSDEKACSKIAWSAAKEAGWHKHDDGKWVKEDEGDEEKEDKKEGEDKEEK